MAMSQRRSWVNDHVVPMFLTNHDAQLKDIRLCHLKREQRQNHSWLVVIIDSHIATGHFLVDSCYSLLTQGLSIDYFHYLVIRPLLKITTRSLTSLKFMDIQVLVLRLKCRT